MRARADPDELASAALVLGRAARVVEEARGGVHPGGTAWLVARVSAAAVPSGMVGAGDPWTRMRLAREIQDGLAAFVVAATVEERRLDALAARLRLVAQLYAEVEAAVTSTLEGLNRTVHDHPDVLERVAEVGNRFALRRILNLGGRVDLLREGPEDMVGLTSAPPRTVPPPTSLADLIATDVDVEQTPGLVRVSEVVRADGSSAWIVHVSGTQEWSPRAGDNVFDVTTDVRSVAGDSTLAAIGVHLALLQAQRSTGRDTSREPVLVSGHSLGGILAAALASDPSFRNGRNVVGVVTAGSPIARMPVPQSVSVVALEHPHDPVPRLDGRPNPPRENWHTVRVSPDVSRTGGLASKTHAGSLYAESAQRVVSDAAESARQEEWEEVVEPFVRGSGRTTVVHDFTLTREWHNPRS